MKKYAVRSLMVCCLLFSTLSFCSETPKSGWTDKTKGSWLPHVVFGLGVLYAAYNEWDKSNTKENVGLLRKGADQTNKNVERIERKVYENRSKILENEDSNQGHAPVVNSEQQRTQRPTKTTRSGDEGSPNLTTRELYRA